MSEIDQPITFHQLVGQCPRVEIPLIQRDFAQGRESEKEGRGFHRPGIVHQQSLASRDRPHDLGLDPPIIRNRIGPRNAMTLEVYPF